MSLQQEALESLTDGVWGLFWLFELEFSFFFFFLFFLKRGKKVEESGADAASAVRGDTRAGICFSEEPHSSCAFRPEDPDALRGKVDRRGRQEGSAKVKAAAR